MTDAPGRFSGNWRFVPSASMSKRNQDGDWIGNVATSKAGPTGTEYVRADTIEAVTTERDALRAENERLKQGHTKIIEHFERAKAINAEEGVIQPYEKEEWEKNARLNTIEDVWDDAADISRAALGDG